MHTRCYRSLDILKLLLLMLIASISLSSTSLYANPIPVASEKWVPYKPKPEELGGSEISVYDRCINVTVKFIFKHSGFKIESRYNISHRYVRFDFYVYEWTGITLPVLTEKVCTITTKPLDPGVYYVQLFISNIEVAALEVAIPDNEESHPSHQEGDLQAILSLPFIGLILLALTVMVVASIYGWIRL